ncbi:hypothetical protein SDC9_176226 [bioreactor metagenome]|uniref:Uncharacterized protein n=1 Tax=bioreactor metagenome TaxID=1076179 RepID=A0A645GPE4_9ZZZZ
MVGKQAQAHGDVADPVGIGMNNGVGHRLAHRRFHIPHFVQGGVQLGQKAGRRGAGEALVGRAGQKGDHRLVCMLHMY